MLQGSGKGGSMKKFASVILLLSCFILISCGGGGGGGLTGKTVIMGVVTDAAGKAVSGVTVTAVGTTATATTGTNGYFSLETGLSESNHQVVSFSKTGYVTMSKISRVISGLGDFLNVVMPAFDTTGTSTFSAATAKTLTDSKAAQVAITANTLVDSSGAVPSTNVTANITSQDPTAQTGFSAFPGEYIGVTSLTDTSTASPFTSYGYAAISATDAAGNALNLKSNSTATLTIPIPATLTNAPATIDLWHFDETTGQWLKIGQGTKVGNNYTAQVTSFSTWNYDISYQASYVKGTVTDCRTGDPINGARVIIKGNNWGAGENGTASNGAYPNSNSFYSTSWLGVPVNPNATFTIWAEKNGVSSAVTTATAPSAGTTSTIDLCIYTIAGTYTGSYSGSNGASGTWTATVAEDGLITGSGSDSNEGDFSISGHVMPNGAISMGTTSLHSGSFSGTINGQTGAATGTWTSDVASGTFSGSRQ